MNKNLLKQVQTIIIIIILLFVLNIDKRTKKAFKLIKESLTN